jgi:hypothetical protein
MKPAALPLLLLAFAPCAFAQAPRFHVQIRAQETISILSQTYALGGAYPVGGEGFTNYARRHDLHLGGLMERGLLRVGLGLRLGLVSQEFYSTAGTLMRNTNAVLATFGAMPELGLRLGPLYAGLGFHWVPTPESNAVFAQTESFDHLLANAPLLRLALDLRLGKKSPVWLTGGAVWSRPLTGGWANQNLGVDGGFRFDLTYYLAVELRYRAWFGLRENQQYAMIHFQYRFTPSFSSSAHWSRPLYLEGAHPQNRIGIGATWTSPKRGD